MTQFLGVARNPFQTKRAEDRRCVDCGRLLREFQDMLCYDCCKNKLEAILRVMGRDPELLDQVKHRYESEEGLYLE